jgi:hypothetical protein
MNPQGLEDEWIKNYRESEAAKNLESIAEQRGLDSASSMGLLGSTPALQALQAGKSNIVAEDRRNYLNDLMDKYMKGAGLSQGIYGTGANAASSMASNASNMGQNAMNMGSNSANMAYGQANAPGNLFESILGMGGSILGGALGGPLGGALANHFGWSTPGSYNSNPNSWTTRGG